MAEQPRDPGPGFLQNRGIVRDGATARAYTAPELAAYEEGRAAGRSGQSPGIVAPYGEDPPRASAWSEGYAAGRAEYAAAQAQAAPPGDEAAAFDPALIPPDESAARLAAPGWTPPAPRSSAAVAVGVGLGLAAAGGLAVVLLRRRRARRARRAG